MPKTEEQYQELKELGEMLIEKGNMLVSMAEASGMADDEESYDEEESEEAAPSGMDPKKKSMLIISLKKKMKGE